MKELLVSVWWNLREWKGLFGVIFFAVLVFLLIRAGLGLFEEKKLERRAALRKWPLVEAIVIDSKIVFRDRSSESGARGDYYVTLKVKYEFEGKQVDTEVRGRWIGSQSLGENDRSLEIGGVIPLRVDPDKPDFASLIELTGNP
ncbi:MAG: DUF3592 domain-containing protein [Akkermansiaceae bacterium]|nr:DUF3592 domain-containing protein [Akkermansiaceae bacterium]